MKNAPVASGLVEPARLGGLRLPTIYGGTRASGSAGRGRDLISPRRAFLADPDLVNGWASARCSIPCATRG
ncbi:hypothetical protein ACFUNF_06260 [Streptomyces sp. NPDC057291]|uniref:hypothetical protein n=1 Tax=Streptomyces sp. NPDC057291 TaxID=3346087 RepID=UPI0036294932